MDRTFRRSNLTVGEIKTYLAMAAGIENSGTIIKWRLQMLVISPEEGAHLMMLSDESPDSPEGLNIDES
jgi:hypothetical protein